MGRNTFHYLLLFLLRPLLPMISLIFILPFSKRLLLDPRPLRMLPPTLSLRTKVLLQVTGNMECLSRLLSKRLLRFMLCML